MIPFAIQDSDFVSEEPYTSHFAREAVEHGDRIKELYKLENPNRRSIKVTYTHIVRMVVLPHGWLPEAPEFSTQSTYTQPRNEQGLERRLRFLV